MRRAALALPIALVSCDGLRPFEPPSYGQASCSPLVKGADELPTVLMDFSATHLRDSFFAAPFPTSGRGGSNLLDKGYPANTALGYRLRDLAPTRAGISSAVYFTLTCAKPEEGCGVPEGALPPLHERPTLASRPSVLLFPLDAPERLAPVNVRVASALFPRADGQLIRRTLLSLLPIQGQPLSPKRAYAAIVTARAARPSPTMNALCEKGTLDGPPETETLYRRALAAAAQIGIPCKDGIAALAVFETADPTEHLRAVQALAKHDFEAHQRDRPIVLTRERDPRAESPRCLGTSFCVYSGAVEVPVYQKGTPPYLPYLNWEGGWPYCDLPTDLDAPRAPCPNSPYSWEPTWRRARVVVTIPRAPSRRGQGYPVLVLARTGGGSETDTLVDRGPILAPSCHASECRGPAEVLQSVGFAGVSVDGPLVGVSRTEPLELNEDLGIFNFLNPLALRDNIRQSGVELALVPEMLRSFRFEGQACESADERIGLDDGHVALFGHSMGATVAPLALANQPKYRAAILSGAGGSLIANALYKRQPVPINAAASLLGYRCTPQEHDPQLSLLQWALEPADAQSYAPVMVTDGARSARHVLTIQGLIDNYILPPIANVMTLAAGLDLGLGPSSCSADPFCDLQPVQGARALQPISGEVPPSLGDLLRDVARRAPISLARQAGGNVPWPSAVPRPLGYPSGDLTALVVQHRIDENRERGSESCAVDGHEVIYESELARHQYACFLSDFYRDVEPRVRLSGHALAGCEP